MEDVAYGWRGMASNTGVSSCESKQKPKSGLKQYLNKLHKRRNSQCVICLGFLVCEMDPYSPAWQVTKE